MRISQLAKQADVNVQTVRYYERRGLLPPPRRRPSGYREYSADAVRLVRFIKRAQALGFSLRDIGELIELRENGGRSCPTVRAAALRKLDHVAERIRRLTAVHKALEQLTEACESARGPCPIIEALNDDRLDEDRRPGRSKVVA